MLNEFHIAETDNFRERLNLAEFQKYYQKIKTYIYPQLRQNPYFGKNIKKLKGEWQNVYKYRIGKLRLFYIINSEKILVIMLDIHYRKDAYK